MRVWIAIANILIVASVSRAQEKPIDFTHDVAPIFKQHCAKCHLNGKHEGEFALDTREAILDSEAIVPGKAAESELLRRVQTEDMLERMPSKGKPLSASEIETLKAWIDQGAAWEPGFTFAATDYVPPLKPRRPNVPAAHDDLTHPIDLILEPALAKEGTTLAVSDDSTFIRRVFLDVIGVLPTPAERDAFLADSAKDKRARLVRALLDDNRAYADHWLTFWNDLLRNDYQGTGYIDGGRKQITRWLYRALAENMPYDAFVRGLIAPGPDSSGFIDGIQWRGRVNASQAREIQFSQNVSQVFFGINMKCASCHDSFIDSWKLEDAYGLAAVISEKPLEMYRCDKATGKIVNAKFLFPELGSIDAMAPKAERLAQLADLVTHAENGRFARTIVNRIWQRMMGHGLVHPVDIMANRPWNEDLLDYLAVYLVDQKYDLRKLIEHIATSRAYQSASAVLASEPSGLYRFQGPESKRMTAEQFLDAVWMLTGTAPTKKIAEVDLPAFAANTPKDRQFVRASLVNADLLQRALGRPNREQVVTTRGSDLSTLQALELSNSESLFEALAQGADRILKQNPDATPKQLAELVFTSALSRAPTEAELQAAQDMLGATPRNQALTDLLWMVVMLPEFQLVR